MPCSETSSPAVSTSGSTLIPHSAFIAHSDPNDALNVNTPTASSPSACVPSWSKLPVYQRPPVPVARFSASAGHREDPGRERPPHARHPVDGDGADRVVDPDPLDEQDAEHGDHAGDQPDDDRRPRRDEPGRRGHGDEGRDHAVEHHRQVGLPQHDPRRGDGADRAGRGRDVRRQRDVREVADPVAGDDPERRARVEAEPAEPEDQDAERDERHVVARIAFGLPSASNLPIRGPSSSAPASAASAPW